MNKLIIPGFASNINIFDNFKTFDNKIKIIDILDHKYETFNKSMLKFKHDKINIFGWSMGSLFALKWSLKYPEKVSSLFLTGATARFCEKEGYYNGISEKKLKQMSLLIKRKTDAVLDDFYNTILKYTDEKGKYKNILMNNHPDIESLINGLDELKNIDLLEDIVKLNVPVFIFQGKNDNITPLKGAEILNGLIPGSKLKIYKGGHCSFLENPKLCFETWNNFLCTVN